MAKFKKHRTRRRKSVGKTTHRRRRVGATALNFSATSPLVKWGSVVIGYLFPNLIPADEIAKAIAGKDATPEELKKMEKAIGYGELGLGALLVFKKGTKKMITTLVGGYLLGAGAKSTMASFNMGGFGPYNLPVVGNRRRLAGPYGSVPVIANFSPNRAMNSHRTNNVMQGINNPQSGYTSTDQGSGYMNS